MPHETVAATLAMLKDRLRNAGIASAQLDARLIVQHACRLSHEQLIADPLRALTETERQSVERLARRRAAHEPVSRLLGEREFYGRMFQIDRSTLDPRPDTETLVETALSISRMQNSSESGWRVADIGTGSGDADTVSLIDLEARPARVVHTLTVGQTPEGITLSPDGAYAAVSVMNGSNKPKASPFFNDYGLVKVLSVKGKELAPLTEAKVGHWCQGSAWSRDAKMVFVQCAVEREIQVFTFDGKALKAAAPIKVNGGPSGIRTN